MRHLAWLLIGFPFIFVSIGSYGIWKQHRRISTYQPIEARVISHEIKEHTSLSSGSRVDQTTYKPVVHYRYTVAGTAYTAEDVFPISTYGERRWAEEILAEFPVGQVTQAFYDPSAPSNAFLIGHYSFLPYLFVLFPMLFIAIGIWLLFVPPTSGENPARPAPRARGWFEILPSSRIATRWRGCLASSAAWVAVGFPAAWHYFHVASPPYGTLAYVTTSIYGVLGLVPIGSFIYNFLLGRNVSDARLFADRQVLRLGEKVRVGVQQTVLKGLLVEEAKIGLVSEERTRTKRGRKTTYSTRECYEEWHSAVTDQDVQRGDSTRFAWAVQIPADQRPSTPPGTKGYPRYEWSFKLQIRLAGSPDYEAKFPIAVLPPEN